jgi:hypothetical protein
VGREKARVLRELRRCGTGEYGYTVVMCRNCAEIDHVPRGCHNRHCPTCLPAAAASWVEEQEARLLPTSYFHVITTLPAALRDLALVNPAPLYDLLMQASKQTLLTFFRNRQPLGCTPSLLQILHTWNQRLDHHPHVHTVVSGGGFNEERQEWVPCPNTKFLFPGKALAKVLCGKFLEGLGQLRQRGALDFSHPRVSALASEQGWQELLDVLRSQPWNVHVKPPFGGPRQVIRYLARYTHRTGLSNRRLVDLRDGRVTFSYRDRKAGRSRTRTLPVESFVSLFAVHILPKGFRRIRACGLIAPNSRDLFATARRVAEQHPSARAFVDLEPSLPKEKHVHRTCANCGSSDLFCLMYLLPSLGRPGAFYEVLPQRPRPPPLPGGAAVALGAAA